jgi:hypothetical protein
MKNKHMNELLILIFLVFVKLDLRPHCQATHSLHCGSTVDTVRYCTDEVEVVKESCTRADKACCALCCGLWVYGILEQVRKMQPEEAAHETIQFDMDVQKVLI